MVDITEIYLSLKGYIPSITGTIVGLLAVPKSTIGLYALVSGFIAGVIVSIYGGDFIIEYYKIQDTSNMVQFCKFVVGVFGFSLIKITFLKLPILFDLAVNRLVGK